MPIFSPGKGITECYGIGERFGKDLPFAAGNWKMMLGRTPAP